MDGNFISTDIRYRDKIKSRRRSTSCVNIVSGNGGASRSKSVGAKSGSGGNLGNAVLEELVDEGRVKALALLQMVADADLN